MLSSESMLLLGCFLHEFKLLLKKAALRFSLRQDFSKTWLCHCPKAIWICEMYLHISWEYFNSAFLYVQCACMQTSLVLPTYKYNEILPLTGGSTIFVLHCYGTPFIGFKITNCYLTKIALEYRSSKIQVSLKQDRVPRLLVVHLT